MPTSWYHAYERQQGASDDDERWYGAEENGYQSAQ